MTDLIGFAGPAGAGKDTVADLLVERYGWRKFSFSDALYAEVAEAFDIDPRFLYAREYKEAPAYALRLACCRDEVFPMAMLELHPNAPIVDFLDTPRSPRWILQRWGTDYRRRQDPLYWIRAARGTLAAARTDGVPGIANTSVRYCNEAMWVRAQGGTVVHVERPGYAPESGYASEVPLPRMPDVDWSLRNDGTLEELAERVSLMVEAL